MVKDITQRKRAHERAVRLSRICQILRDTNEAIVRMPDEASLFQYVCDLTLLLDDFPLVWIGMHEAERNVLAPKAAAGDLAGAVQGIEFSLDPATPAGQALVCEVFRGGVVLVSNGYGADTGRAYWHEQAVTTDVASIVGLPLRRQGAVVGVLGIGSREVKYFSAEVVHLLESMALDISFGLDNLSRVEELRESEERYHKLFEEATEGICLADAESGEILECNRALTQLTGYDRVELIGKPQLFLHPREDEHSQVFRTFALHRGEECGAIFATELLTKSGTLRKVEIKANMLELGGRKAVQEYFRDVTDELRYHRERDTTLKLLRLLNDLNDTRELICSLTGLLQEWTGCEAVGVRLGEAEDFPYFETRGFPAEFVQAENSLCMRDREGQLMRDSQGDPAFACMCGCILSGRYNPALPFFTSKGSFWTNSTTELLVGIADVDRPPYMRGRCNAQGYESVGLVPLRYRGQTFGLLQVNDRSRDRFTPELITFLENISDQIAMALAQRQAQAALRVSEQRFRDISEAAGEFVWEIDLEGQFTYVSERVDFLEYRPEELIGRLPGEFMEDADAKRTKAIIARAVRTEEGFRDFEHCFISKSGRRVWATATGVPIVGTAGELLGFRGATLDITARKEAEERLRAQGVRLREANAAMKVLINQREQDRVELEESILDNVKLLIVPYLEKLKRTRLKEDQSLYLEILESHIKEVTSHFVRKLAPPFLGLTPTEIRVSDLIRQGKTSKEIAEILGISERAVLFHRQSIRGKLGLKQKKVNLQSYLATIG